MRSKSTSMRQVQTFKAVGCNVDDDSQLHQAPSSGIWRSLLRLRSPEFSFVSAFAEFGFSVGSLSGIREAAALPLRRLSELEFEAQRELHLARRSRAHRGDRRYDGCVQVHRIDDAAEARGVRRVESGLRLTELRVIEDVVELRAEFKPPALPQWKSSCRRRDRSARCPARERRSRGAVPNSPAGVAKAAGLIHCRDSSCLPAE